jgi:hypothetical protein
MQNFIRTQVLLAESVHLAETDLSQLDGIKKIGVGILYET